MILNDDDLARLQRAANDAIWTHHGWVTDLRRAIDTGHSTHESAEVRRPERCPIGTWLASGVPAALHAHAIYIATQAAHERFHAEAAAVIDDALAGERARARASMDRGGTFFAAAAAMREALYAWATLAR